MCHKGDHVHCVKVADVAKKLLKSDWQLGPCPAPGINPCGQSGNKTLMCHKPNRPSAHTHCVKNKDVPKKLQKSDWIVGPCPNSKTGGSALCGFVEEAEAPEGEEIMLEAWPNPFSQSLKLEFQLPTEGKVRLVVLDIMGRELEVLFTGVAKAERRHSFAFDAANLAPGLYYARLESGGNTLAIRKLTLVK